MTPALLSPPPPPPHTDHRPQPWGARPSLETKNQATGEVSEGCRLGRESPPPDKPAPTFTTHLYLPGVLLLSLFPKPLSKGSQTGVAGKLSPEPQWAPHQDRLWVWSQRSHMPVLALPESPCATLGK